MSGEPSSCGGKGRPRDRSVRLWAGRWRSPAAPLAIVGRWLLAQALRDDVAFIAASPEILPMEPIGQVSQPELKRGHHVTTHATTCP